MVKIKGLLQWLLVVAALVAAACAARRLPAAGVPQTRSTYTYRVEHDGSITLYVVDYEALKLARRELCGAGKLLPACSAQAVGTVYVLAQPR